MRILSFLLVLLTFQPGYALGPLDGEITIDWWSNELSGDPFDGTLDAGTLSLRAETWWDQKWGVRGGLSLSDIDDSQLEDRHRFNFDVKRRLISPTDNTFIAAGLGWENLRLENGENSQGVRLSLEGRLGLGGFATLYGESILLPNLDDADGYRDLSATEFEAGVVFDPLPFVSIRAGYRQFELDYNLSSGRSGESSSQGIIIGTGIHW